ncbi:MAG TPA: hemerythrin [Desulfobulbaceae bacterium]|nr:hemerythrin [Desulfobulbaceae bacterium]
MNPITELQHEHEAVRTALAILSVMADTAKIEGRLDIDAVDDLLEFLRVFVDRCHHGKEEKLLFPALEEVGIGRNGGPIGVMLAEHRLGRQAIAGMGSALMAYWEGDSDAAERFAAHAAAYHELLDRHIDKENNVLFVLAERHLSAELLAVLAEEFAALEKEEIGVGRHEAFHQRLDELAARYLVDHLAHRAGGGLGHGRPCQCAG